MEPSSTFKISIRMKDPRPAGRGEENRFRGALSGYPTNDNISNSVVDHTNGDERELRSSYGEPDSTTARWIVKSLP